MTLTATRADQLRRAPQQERSVETVASIEKAARELVAEVGRDGVTMAAVARRAGMSGPGLYRYFPKLAVLLQGVAPLNRVVTTLDEIEQLSTGSVLLCRVGEVFHLHDAPGGAVWLAAGYGNTWSPSAVAEWAPLTVLSEGSN